MYVVMSLIVPLNRFHIDINVARKLIPYTSHFNNADLSNSPFRSVALTL